jgi:hypothetical protein
MSADQEISFVHQWVNSNHALTQSLCLNCGDFVGASADQKKLTIAEAAHVCGYIYGTTAMPPIIRPESA